MIMSIGEKMIWAAVFTARLKEIDQSKAGNSDTVAVVDAASIATNVIEAMRSTVEWWNAPPMSNPYTDSANSSTLPMLRAMLGDDG